MAIGKKNDDAQTSLAGSEPAIAARDDAEISGALFAAAAPEEEATPAPEAAEPAPGGDLMNMFQTSQVELDDISAILDLAGDVDIADLVEDLHTVAAAIGIATDRALAA